MDSAATRLRDLEIELYAKMMGNATSLEDTIEWANKLLDYGELVRNVERNPWVLTACGAKLKTSTPLKTHRVFGAYRIGDAALVFTGFVWWSESADRWFVEGSPSAPDGLEVIAWMEIPELPGEIVCQ